MRTVSLLMIITLIPLTAGGVEQSAGTIDEQIRAEEKAIEDLSLRYQSALREKREIEERIREEDLSITDLTEELLDQEQMSIVRQKLDIDERIREKERLAVYSREQVIPIDTEKPQQEPVADKSDARAGEERTLKYAAEIDALIQKQKMLLEQGVWLETEMRKQDEMIHMGKGLPE